MLFNFKHYTTLAILASVGVVSSAPVSDLGPAPNNTILSVSDLAPYRNHTVSSLAVYGEESRHSWPSTQYPFSAIQQITFTGIGCTVSVVGPRHLLTARHCIPKGYMGKSMKYTNNAGSANMIDMLMLEETEDCDNLKDDFAVLVMDQPIFERFGYLGIRTFDCESQMHTPKFENAGFPVMDHEMQRIHQNGVSVTGCYRCDGQNALIGTDADADKGQSGGPLYTVENGVGWQYGVMSHVHGLRGTVFAGGNHLTELVAMARHRYP
ncbi:uncharacterized protein FIESC28_09745 [Fusarium coffeatum]|uniref:Peptidase S1 domain-containing protein n=1 Tax=Fusarium coffeatum TaxID=231269 RepID=A0A366QXL3_9HYPO|nr:uncharacterized protein FIESC28_09745 [Fusarium coffeatum]RBR09633.1 hypothetical protein FIESC28_09745 [Fusarium coffeatum]